MKISAYSAGNLGFDATIVLTDRLMETLPVVPLEPGDRVMWSFTKDIHAMPLVLTARAAYAQHRGERAAFLAIIGGEPTHLEYRITWSDLDDEGTTFTIDLPEANES